MEPFTNQPLYVVAKDVISLLLTIVGLIVAALGLVTWKKQIKGSKDFETAYSLHNSILKMRDAIRYVRNPAIWPSEGRQAMEYQKEKYPEKTEKELKEDANVAVYEMRWEKIAQASTDMESHLLAAEVLWGPEILKLMRPLNKKVSELNIALRQNFQSDYRTLDYQKIHDTIYDKGNGDDIEDDFTKEVKVAIEGIVTYLKPKMK